MSPPYRTLTFVLSLILLPAMVSFGELFRPQIDPDEEIAFYGPYLYWDSDGSLNLVLRGRFFEPEKDGIVRRSLVDRAVSPALFRYIGKKPSDFDDAARSLMYDRLAPFLADGESGETLKMRVVGQGGAATLTLPKTDAGGHFSITTTTAGAQAVASLVGPGKDLQVQAMMPPEDKRRFVARLPVPPRRLPLLVVSDFDDTVRIAEVTDRPRMIERVFLHRYEAVPGMSSVYHQLAERGARFHFVTGSPWQIAPAIEEFLADTKFPPAVLHLRQIGWDFWNSDPVDTKKFKIATIELLLQQFPSCKVLMVGDDGEHDPEVYTEIFRSHTVRVAGIWIRRVRDRWEADRLAEARRVMGQNRVVAFEDAAELGQAIQTIDVSR